MHNKFRLLFLTPTLHVWCTMYCSEWHHLSSESKKVLLHIFCLFLSCLTSSPCTLLTAPVSDPGVHQVKQNKINSKHTPWPQLRVSLPCSQWTISLAALENYITTLTHPSCRQQLTIANTLCTFEQQVKSFSEYSSSDGKCLFSCGLKAQRIVSL